MEPATNPKNNPPQPAGNIPIAKPKKGSNTKLIIAIIVIAAVLLVMIPILAAILSGVPSSGGPSFAQYDCVRDPTVEVSQAISIAQGGLSHPTGTICLNAGESLTTSSIETAIDQPQSNAGSTSMAFNCQGSPSACNSLDLKPFEITAKEDVAFTIMMTCQKSNGPVEYDCSLEINDPI